MIFGRQQEPIDAPAELERIEGERGASDVGAQRRPLPPGARAFMVASLTGVLLLGGWISYKALAMRAEAPQSATQAKVVRQVIPELPKRAAARIEPPAAVPAPVVYRDYEPQPDVSPFETAKPSQAAPVEKSPEQIARERMLGSSLGTSTAGSGVAPTVIEAQQESDGELAARLRPVKLRAAKATLLGNRDYLLTEGSTLDCVLQTKMISTQPGMAVCLLARDVYSASGRVVLFDRGTKFVGPYDGSIKQGQARMFVMWSRAETPRGVVIALNSPGTGPLGEAGVGGHIDRHTWERFGGSIMLSLIGDVGQALSNKASTADNSISLSGTMNGMENAAAEALRHSINIPPTLTKNQGERVAILVARDLNFEGIYGLEPK